jgi:hypothetical protein
MRTGTALLLAAVAALALSACGSSGPSGGAASGSGRAQGTPLVHAGLLRFSACMRSHGVPNFPDPNATGLSVSSANGIDPRSPAFQSAMQSCSKLLPGGGPGNGSMSPAQRRRILAGAECMRTHGVPDFPDPIIEGNAVRMRVPNPADANSPAFKKAAQECNQPVPGRPPGGGKGAGFFLSIGGGGQ